MSLILTRRDLLKRSAMAIGAFTGAIIMPGPKAWPDAQGAIEVPTSWDAVDDVLEDTQEDLERLGSYDPLSDKLEQWKEDIKTFHHLDPYLVESRPYTEPFHNVPNGFIRPNADGTHYKIFAYSKIASGGWGLREIRIPVTLKETEIAYLRNAAASMKYRN